MPDTIAGARTSLALLLVGIATTDLAFRVAQVATPLVVLAATGSPAATGLATGAVGVPVLLSPWWTTRLRHRISSGRALALCYLGEAASLSLVPAAVGLDRLSVPLLLASGLGLGCAEALSGPGRDAMIADLGDRTGDDRALVMLNRRELFRRIGMVAGPALGGLLVAAGHGVGLLWTEVAAILASGLLALPVGRVVNAVPGGGATPRIRDAVRRRPQVLTGWIVRGAGCASWFAFSLGLSLLGVELGTGKPLLAWGMAGYGVGAVAGTAVTVSLLRRLPVLPSIVGAWAVTGLCWTTMGVLASPMPVAALAVVSGVTVAVGNAGVTAQITRSSAGPERRTLIAGQAVVVNAASSSGLLVGGAVLAVLGAARTMELVGLTLAAVAVLTPVIAARGLPVTVRATRTSCHDPSPRYRGETGAA